MFHTRSRRSLSLLAGLVLAAVPFVLPGAPAHAQNPPGVCTTPIYGDFDITFSNGTTHRGTLCMSGCKGTFTVSFFDPVRRRTETISETMILRNTPRGIVLYGYDPVWEGTRVRHSGYAADNLVFEQDVWGRWTGFLLDDAGILSPVALSPFRPH